MKDRIKQLMETQQMTQQNFASLLGLPPASLSSIFNERTKPTLNHVEAIQRAFPNINLSWLISGQGQMFIESDTNAASSHSSTTPLNAISSAQGSLNPKAGATSGQPGSTNFDGQLFGDEALLDFDVPQSQPQSYTPTAPAYRAGRQMALQHESVDMKNIDKQRRKISEIRVYYDDQTFELFVPKK